jgi:putative phosphoesterase
MIEGRRRAAIANLTQGLRVLIGLIADTHGLLRPEAIDALRGVDLILHAGDVGAATVLRELRTVAAVRAVRGNVDDPQDPALAERLELTVDGVTLHVSHGHELGAPTPAKLLQAYAADVIVYGHTHRALVHRAGARLVVNPGAAGPRRFDLRPSVARLTARGAGVDVELIDL